MAIAVMFIGLSIIVAGLMIEHALLAVAKALTNLAMTLRR